MILIKQGWLRLGVVAVLSMCLSACGDGPEGEQANADSPSSKASTDQVKQKYHDCMNALPADDPDNATVAMKRVNGEQKCLSDALLNCKTVLDIMECQAAVQAIKGQ